MITDTRGILTAADVRSLGEPVQNYRENLPLVAGVSGHSMLARYNPVLRQMGRWKDEREWQQMLATEPELVAGMKSITRMVVGAGFTIRTPGKLTTPAKIRLRDMAQSAVRRIPQFSQVLAEIGRADAFGWELHQQLWSVDAFSFKGVSQWGMTRVIVQPQEFYYFTPEDDLVFIGSTTMTPEYFPRISDPVEALGWMATRAGTTRGCYGEPSLAGLWFLWYVKRQFDEWFSRGFRRAVDGLPVFKESGGSISARPVTEGSAGTGKERGAELTRLYSDIQKTQRFLEQHGAIAVPQDIDFNLETLSSFVGDCIKAMQYLDTKFHLALEGQSLTYKTDTTGSRAQADVHQNTKLDCAKDLGRLIRETASEQIVHKILYANLGNEGAEVDPEDLPELAMRIENMVDPSLLKMFCDLGGRADGVEVASAWGVPIASDDSEVVLSVQPTQTIRETLGGPGGAPGAPGQPSEPQPPEEGIDTPEGPDKNLEPSRNGTGPAGAPAPKKTMGSKPST